MPLKTRIAIIQFLQFFVWGSWLLTIGAWWFGTKHWSGMEFGAVFSTMGLGALFMPALMGIIADRFINAEKLYGILHLGGAAMLFCVPHMDSPTGIFWIMLVNMCFYMPTISLLYTISYSTMKKAGMDIIQEYPPLRVLGTVGFIVAMWTISLLHLETSSWMFYIGAISAVCLGLYGFTLPACPPLGTKSSSLVDALGLDALKLFKNYKMALFFVFSLLLGGILQINNAYGIAFLHSFEQTYQSYLAVKYPAIISSLSQMSEVCFIFAIPFFLKRFGIKKVMMMSMFAWVFRFGLYGFGNPAGGLWMIIMSCIVYGMAFDFFNVSGSLYVEQQVSPSIRASAQGLFILMTNGIGAFLGSFLSGWGISKFFTSTNGDIQWQGMHGVWMTFAVCSLVIGVFFTLMFKYKHVRATEKSELAVELVH